MEIKSQSHKIYRISVGAGDVYGPWPLGVGFLSMALLQSINTISAWNSIYFLANVKMKRYLQTGRKNTFSSNAAKKT